MITMIKDSWKEFKTSDLITKLIMVWLVSIIVGAVVSIFRMILSD